LSDVSLDVAPDEFVTLPGPSGSGKTTLQSAALADTGLVADRRRNMASPPLGLDKVVFFDFSVAPPTGNALHDLSMTGAEREKSGISRGKVRHSAAMGSRR
jgi:ABC-type taurine transport system ATPase subunit